MEAPGVTLLELQDWAGPEVLDAALDELGCDAPERVVTLERAFWDTFDWRLWRKGLVLEHRVAGGSRRLVLRRAGASEVLHEWPYDDVPVVMRHLPPGPIADAVRPIAGIRALLRCARTTETTSTRPYRNVVDTVVAEITVTRTEVLAGGALGDEGVAGRELPPLVAVRPASGYIRPFERIVDDLSARTNPYVPGQPLVRGLDGEVTEPLAPAMWALGRSVGDYSSSLDVTLHPTARAEDGLRRLLEHLVGVLERNAPGVRADLDIEFLHDFRVAVRRARTLLAGAKGAMPPDLRRRLRADLKWLGDVTTPVRDLDVHLEELDELTAAGPDALPWGLGTGLAPMRDVLAARREAAFADLLAALDDERYGATLAAFSSWFDGPPTPTDVAAHADDPMLWFASRRIAKAHRVLVAAGEAIDDDSPPEDLHELRKDAKRLRYYVEAFRGLHPSGLVDPALKELRRLQDVLGEFQDTTVQVELIVHVADDLAGRSPRALLAMGTLLAHQSDRHDRSRARFAKRFDRFSARKVSRRFARLGSRPAAVFAEEAEAKATAKAAADGPGTGDGAAPASASSGLDTTWTDRGPEPADGDHDAAHGAVDTPGRDDATVGPAGPTPSTPAPADVPAIGGPRPSPATNGASHDHGPDPAPTRPDEEPGSSANGDSTASPDTSE
ncbi:MAG: CHAD domain-containing protein [Actinomycetota bacterium]|nr:CHAD domain-containing protein [Actinomycetota bacterium]